MTTIGSPSLSGNTLSHTLRHSEPVPAPSGEALALLARIGRHGLPLAELRDAANRRGLLCALARGAALLTTDGAGGVLVVRRTGR
jgi:hypothetical protein